MLEIIRIAHIAIFTQRRRLIDLGHDQATGRGLLSESARIVFSDAREATREVRTLAERWGEQQLLDPDSAPATRALLDEEIQRTEARLARLLARQERIAGELRRLENEPGGPAPEAR